ncbi:hypothetical protein SAMN02745163_03746 [Clostridium cavendishii DSM 21758]|uniref:Bacteriophage lambda head decoration protein D n=1 Tax=Clostridium cavendishii DSM 21758 TaxID=1121302 RepID=A0A1M6S4G3_9CLOT|nr:hypothetical protein [Clostridium cavendishii]SHK39408.1 hypothetical protein SAMN02745163_03746 [Clostridium cavendishii DSM 21758]
MYWKKETYKTDMEILATEANLVTFSGTVKSANITPDEHGRKYVTAGSLMDATGVVVTVNGDALTGTPVGILYKTVDVTKGDMPCSLVVEGYLRADRVLAGLSDKVVSAIKSALPNIKFR